MRSHRDLDVWKQAMDLAEAVYSLTAGYPTEERFGLVAQTRRAAVSVAANLAEGAARRTRREFRHFAYVSLGSASELETLLELAARIRAADLDALRPVMDQLARISRMLQGVIRWLERNAEGAGGD